MSSNLSSDNVRYIAELVEAGEFANEAQALDEAVSLLRRRQNLRRDVQAGIEQADRGELRPAADVFQRLEARAHQIEKAARGR